MTQFTRKVLDHGFVTLRNMSGPTRRAFQQPLPNGEPHDPANILPGGLEWRPFDADDTDVANSARRAFGGTDGHKYVNGILNKLAPQLRPVEVASDKAASPLA